MKKKILIIHHHRKFGGSSKSISEFITSLKKNFEIEIICPFGTAYNYFKKKKFNTHGVVGVPCFDITEIGIYKSTRRLLLIREIIFFFFFLIKTINVSKKKFDIVHLNDSNLIIITPLIKFFFRCKILCHIRTRIASRIQIPNFILNFSKKYVDSFISIDQSTFATSIEPTKTKVIYNIFPLHKLKKNNKSKNLIIGFLGTLDFHKGLDFLFNTIQYINQKKNNFIFLIAGGLSVQSNFILKILSFFKIKKNFNSVFKSFNNNKYKNVLFLGEIIDIEKFYEKIDIIVFPSRMNALGRPVLEAASYGIPSIVCLRSYYNDTFIKNKTGFIVKFSDKLNFKKKLIFLHKNKKLIKTMGLNARNNFKKIHLPKTNIKNLKTIYENL